MYIWETRPEPHGIACSESTGQPRISRISPKSLPFLFVQFVANSELQQLRLWRFGAASTLLECTSGWVAWRRLRRRWGWVVPSAVLLPQNQRSLAHLRDFRYLSILGDFQLKFRSFAPSVRTCTSASSSPTSTVSARNSCRVRNSRTGACKFAGRR